MSFKTHQLLTEKLRQILAPARAELISLPLTPEIELFLINQDIPQDELSHDEMLAVMNYPAYWAFCWASGQVLAQFILEQPEWVTGKRVLDFGCGSGVVAIAAAKAGAESVVACDIDEDAVLATQANAEHNQVDIEIYEDFYQVPGINSDTLHSESLAFDIIIVADVLYDKANLSWLSTFLDFADTVLIADSRVKNFSHPPYELIERREGTTVPDLDEFDEFRDVRVYCAKVDH